MTLFPGKEGHVELTDELVIQYFHNLNEFLREYKDLVYIYFSDMYAFDHQK